ncbi:unnamed protein product [Mytilus edulis]|nr:unnamed protein product [Mytilus edulis]
MNYLLESYHIRSQKNNSEVDSVTFEVNNLVTSICTQIRKYDSRFEMSVFPSGMLFSEYLKRALNEPLLWKEGNLYFNIKNEFTIRHDKPVITFGVYWFGSVYKKLRISIDLVPAVYKRGWWPTNTDVYKIPLISPDIKAAGCFLILQTKKLKISVDISHCISQTCNTEDDDEELAKKRMLRISTAPAEICLMKSLPNKFRQAYVLAKILKNVCPEIDVETKQYGLE